MRVALFISTMMRVARDVWKVSRSTVGIHWHVVGFNSKEQYEIIFKALHEAHLKYEEQLKVLQKKQ